MFSDSLETKTLKRAYKMKNIFLILILSIVITLIIFALPKMVVINCMLLLLAFMSFLPFYLLKV